MLRWRVAITTADATSPRPADAAASVHPLVAITNEGRSA
jgi:hypothetical protein